MIEHIHIVASILGIIAPMAGILYGMGKVSQVLGECIKSQKAMQQTLKELHNDHWKCHQRMMDEIKDGEMTHKLEHQKILLKLNGGRK